MVNNRSEMLGQARLRSNGMDQRREPDLGRHGLPSLAWAARMTARLLC